MKNLIKKTKSFLYKFLDFYKENSNFYVYESVADAFKQQFSTNKKGF